MSENILYDVLLHKEWRCVDEVVQRGKFFSTNGKPKLDILKDWFSSLFTSTIIGLPRSLYNLKFGVSLPYKLAVGYNKKSDVTLTAIAFQDVIEIRSSRDNYTTAVSKCVLANDPHPGWRQLHWSPDCSLVMLAYSNGNIDVFDLLGIKLCAIATDFSSISNSELPGLADFSASVVNILFVDVRGTLSQKWNYKIIVANYKGYITCYYLNSINGEHEKLFSLHISAASSTRMPAPTSIVDICHHELHPNMVFIASPPNIYDDIPESYGYGLSIWRLLSDYPHLKIVTTELADEPASRSKFSVLQWVKDMFSRFNHFQIQDWVQKISLSPDGRHLIAAHESGAVSLWDVPSLKLSQYWSLDDQPTNDLFRQGNLKALKKYDLKEKDLLKFSDIYWWNNKAVVLARVSGALTIASITADMPLLNLLGDSPEFLDCPPMPCLTTPKDERFFFLDCDSKVRTKNRRAALDRSQLNEVEERSSEDEENENLSLVSSASFAAKSMLYFLTDSERFQPPKKKSKIKVDTYHLKEFKIATPDELFRRRLTSKEYEEALEIAEIYDLNTDVVYQTQWRDHAVSVTTVKKILTKIRNETWVINECLESVPLDPNGTRALLEYGLKLSDAEHIFASLSLSEPFSPDVANIRVEQLSVEQKERIVQRARLLQYLKRLDTYLKILNSSDSPYDPSFYKTFRNQPAFEAAIGFAQDSNVEAVSLMLTRHCSETRKHLLAILSNFPETLSPRKYEHLLPKCCPLTGKVLLALEDADNSTFNDDWCFQYFNSVIPMYDTEFEKNYYIEHKNLLQYCEPDITKEQLSIWFQCRAREIEQCSSLVENSLSLLEIGIEHDVPALLKLLDDFETFETICYYCIPFDCKEQIDFSRFDRMTNIQKVDLVMSGATEASEIFIKRTKEYLLPFLEKCQKTGCSRDEYYTLLSHYFTSLAKNDLTLVAKIFEYSKVSVETPEKQRLIKDIEHLLRLAIDCIYACEEADQLDSAFDILECLPQTPKHYPIRDTSLYEQIALLEKHLAAAELLEQYNYQLTVKDVKNLQDSADPDQIKQIFIHLTRVAIKKVDPPFKEKEWQQLLTDILEIRQDCFHQVVSVDDVYEIFVKALMVSGKRENFGLASSYMQLTSEALTKKKKLLSYHRSINVLLEAAREYINSANSITDKVVDLAKECLLLINKEERRSNEQVKEELDFVEALQLLYSEFDMKLLPIQVRLIEQPRLNIISKVLQNDPIAAKNSAQLLKLAQLLRVCREDEIEVREGKVLTLVGNFLFDHNYFTDCWQLCRTLIKRNYTSAWHLCKKLGNCDNFRNREARLQLLAFVAAYCEDYTGQEIENTLHEIRRIKALPEDELNGMQQNIVDKSLDVVSKTASQLTSWVKR